MQSKERSWRRGLSENLDESISEHNRTIQSYNAFVIRTPILPLKAGLLAAGVDSIDREIDENSYVKRRAEEVDGLATLLYMPAVVEGIYIASHSLAKRLYGSGGASKFVSDKSLQLAVYRYINRMSSRPTPFGRFASVGTGRVSGANNFLISPRSDCFRVARVDMGRIYTVANDLIKDRGFLKDCKLRTNTTIYKAAECWRYTEVHEGSAFQLSSISDETFLNYCITSCRSPRPFHILAAELQHIDESLNDQDIEEFIVHLIKEQVLVPDIFPKLTSENPVQDFVDRLRIPGNEAATHLSKNISDAQKLLDSIRNVDSAQAVETYKLVDELLESLPKPNEIASKSSSYQVDTHINECHTTISHELCEVIGKSVEHMMKLCASARNDELTSFAERFTDRFGSNEVPLTHALDKDFGIDFGNSGPAQPEFASVLGLTPKGQISGVITTSRDELLLSKLTEAWRGRREEIILQVTDLDRLTDHPFVPSPFRCSALFELARKGTDDNGDVEFDVYLKTLLAPLGAQVLGRFCGGDPRLSELVSEMILAEHVDQPDKIFAEIVHIPPGRNANIANRPAFRHYEIPLLTMSGVNEEKQIPLSDIMVWVYNGEIHLRSRRMGAEIIPRLTNAHNYGLASNLAVYRFLALLSTEHAGSCQFSWGPVFDSCEYLPRVRLGEIVISPAMWRYTNEELIRLRTDSHSSDFGRYRLVRELCETKRIPRFVWLETNATKMFVDFLSPTSVDNFLSMLLRHSHVRLVECFQRDENILCYNDDGHFCSEFILPLILKNSKDNSHSKETSLSKVSPPDKWPRNSNSVNPPPIIPKSEVMLPGSAEWSYFKIYGSEESLDAFIRDSLLELLVRSCHPCSPYFFFVRYADPRWHLRIRLKGALPIIWSEVVPRVLSSISHIATQYAIDDIIIDSYRPEIDRYGGSVGLSLCEEIFKNDSLATINGLRELGASDPSIRWKMAALSAYQLGHSLMGDDSSTADLFNDLFCAFMGRFKITRGVKQEFSSTFRRLRPDLEHLLGDKHEAGDLEVGLCRVFQERENANLASVCELRSKYGSTELRSIASSLVHMSMNRIFKYNSNQNETLVYYLIARLLESLQARN